MTYKYFLYENNTFNRAKIMAICRPVQLVVDEALENIRERESIRCPQDLNTTTTT